MRPLFRLELGKMTVYINYYLLLSTYSLNLTEASLKLLLFNSEALLSYV